MDTIILLTSSISELVSTSDIIYQREDILYFCNNNCMVMYKEMVAAPISCDTGCPWFPLKNPNICKNEPSNTDVCTICLRQQQLPDSIVRCNKLWCHKNLYVHLIIYIGFYVDTRNWKCSRAQPGCQVPQIRVRIENVDKSEGGGDSEWYFEKNSMSEQNPW